MEFELLKSLKDCTWQTLAIAFSAFLLTYLIKMPIKKWSSKLNEDKRKMSNTIIIFIPFVLSLIASILYYGLTKSNWFSLFVLDSAFSSWVCSLSLYAIVTRICIVIKGLKSGSSKVNNELTKDTIKYIKENIKTISHEVKSDKKDLSTIKDKLQTLLKLREQLTQDTVNPDQTKTYDVNCEINTLQEQETTINAKIQKSLSLIDGYKNQLYSKTTTQ